MDTYATKCPRCSRRMELDRGYDGEGGVGYCCEYAFYWDREWTVRVNKDNQRSYDEMMKERTDAAGTPHSKESK